ncbi:MAG TPA: site-specific integrase [Candidatus Thermoplasmatota archaeon]|nr:site-specific integrase [Candidatus Thermoplasmatota archaeon]
METRTLQPPLSSDLAARVVIDWRLLRDFQLIDLGHAAATVDTRLRSARHMARTGFSWATFARAPDAAALEARRWLAWKKVSSGPNALPAYELLLKDVVAYLRSSRPEYVAVEISYTDAEYGHPDPYSAAEVAALQAYTAPREFTTLRRRAMNLLSSYWGARRGEQSRTNEEDLDFDALTLDMRLPGKGGRKRKLPLPSLLASPKRALIPYLEEKHRRFPGAKALWVTDDGVRFGPSSLSRETWHMSQDLGFPVSFNRWRRSWNTTVRRCRCPKETAKYLLGHQSRDATDHYWEPDVEDIRACLHAHQVPGFIRSRNEVPARPHLPVPFARSVDAVLA